LGTTRLELGVCNGSPPRVSGWISFEQGLASVLFAPARLSACRRAAKHRRSDPRGGGSSGVQTCNPTPVRARATLTLPSKGTPAARWGPFRCTRDRRGPKNDAHVQLAVTPTVLSDGASCQGNLARGDRDSSPTFREHSVLPACDYDTGSPEDQKVWPSTSLTVQPSKRAAVPSIPQRARAWPSDWSTIIVVMPWPAPSVTSWGSTPSRALPYAPDAPPTEVSPASIVHTPRRQTGITRQATARPRDDRATLSEQQQRWSR
jgi:hypothetical protein